MESLTPSTAAALVEATRATRRAIYGGVPHPERATHEVRFLEVEGRRLVLKVFRSSLRHEAEREWLTLKLLAQAGSHEAPVPVWSDLEHAMPAIAMSRLPGTPLAEGPWTPSELERLAGLIEQLFVHRATGLPPATHGGRFVLERLLREWPPKVPEATPEIARTALAAGRSWLASVERDGVPGSGPEVLGRQDYSRSNFLRYGRSLLHVDFEDCCCLPRPVELAQLREHLTSHATPEGRWQDLVDAFELDAAERALHRAARRWLALFWLRALLPGGPAAARNPDGTLERQAHRVLSLLHAG